MTKQLIRMNSWWRRFLIRLLIDPISKKYNYQPRRGQLPEGANLIIANHVTKMDQFFFISHYYKDFMYFVASEDIAKSRAFKWMAGNLLGIIVHMRGNNAIKTTKTMLKYLKDGANVAIFPEGSASFDGKTAAMDPSIAKVAKLGNCNLVMIRIEGGYLSRPRWRPSMCRGRVDLCQQVISREELANMTPKELTTIINGWLYTDAYGERLDKPVAFKGKEPCRGLESCIYLCPKCGEITGLKTNATDIFCECGFYATYDDYGFLTDGKGAKHTITQWCDDQKAYLRRALEEARNTGVHSFLFQDDFNVKKAWPDGKRQTIGMVHMDVYTDRVDYFLEGDKGSYRLEEVENLFIFQRNPWNCQISGLDYRYEMTGDFSSNALKYQDLWQIINQ